jgi:hypothetical protein
MVYVGGFLLLPVSFVSVGARLRMGLLTFMKGWGDSDSVLIMFGVSKRVEDMLVVGMTTVCMSL